MSEIDQILSSEEVRNAASSKIADSHSFTWNGLEIVVKKYLTQEEIMLFADNVTNMCFVSDEDGERYYPELRDFMIRANIVDKYTNIKLPDNILDFTDVLYGTDLVSSILTHVDKEQYNSLIKAIGKRIEYTANSTLNSLYGKVNILTNKFEELEDTITAMFDGIDNETLTTAVNSVTDTGIDEGKLVQSVINAESKS